jgi:hypothetical protein
VDVLPDPIQETPLVDSGDLEFGEEASEECVDSAHSTPKPTDENNPTSSPSTIPKTEETTTDGVSEKEIEAEPVPRQKSPAVGTPRAAPARARQVTEYTGFSRQGESIPSIPCDTGSVSITGSAAAGATSSPNRGSASGGERVVSVLSGFLKIADAF